jgi:hypothetical protein
LQAVFGLRRCASATVRWAAARGAAISGTRSANPKV